MKEKLDEPWRHNVAEALIEIGILQTQLKSKGTLNALVQCHLAIEKMEHECGDDTDTDYSQAPKSNKYYEKSRYIRKMKWI